MIKAPFYAWLILTVIFFILEVGHPGLFLFLSFSIGALAASILSYFDLSYSSQALIFITGSSIGLLILKRWLKNHRDFNLEETNVYALARKCGKVTFACGDIIQVKVGGQIWTVNTNDNLAVGDVVEVVDVKGCKLTVKKMGEL